MQSNNKRPYQLQVSDRNSGDGLPFQIIEYWAVELSCYSAEYLCVSKS